MTGRDKVGRNGFGFGMRPVPFQILLRRPSPTSNAPVVKSRRDGTIPPIRVLRSGSTSSRSSLSRDGSPTAGLLPSAVGFSFVRGDVLGSPRGPSILGVWGKERGSWEGEEGMAFRRTLEPGGTRGLPTFPLAHIRSLPHFRIESSFVPCETRSEEQVVRSLRACI